MGLNSLPQIWHCSLTASFSLTSLHHHFIPQKTVCLVWGGGPQEGLSSLRAQSAPPSQGSPIDKTAIHCFLLIIQRSLPYANIHSGHRVETEHQLCFRFLLRLEEISRSGDSHLLQDEPSSLCCQPPELSVSGSDMGTWGSCL